MSKEKAVKRVVVGKENEESETGYGILGAFVTTYDVEFGEIRVVRLRFQAHVMVLGINDVTVMFTTMVNKELTFLTSRFFLNWVRGNVPKKIKMHEKKFIFPTLRTMSVSREAGNVRIG